MQVSRGVLGGKIWILVLLEYISKILEQKLEFLNRTQRYHYFFFNSVTEDMNTLVFLKIYSFLPIAINHWLF